MNFSTMKKRYTAFMLLLVLSSCSAVHLSYYGRNSTPTDKADIFLYERDVSVPYEVLGRADMSMSSFVSNTSDKVKNLLTAQAEKVGADAVILYDESQMPLLPTTLTTSSKDRSVNAMGDTVTTRTSVTSAQAPQPVFSPVFIKYKSTSED